MSFMRTLAFSTGSSTPYVVVHLKNSEIFRTYLEIRQKKHLISR